MQDNSTSLFYVPTEPEAARLEASYVPSIFAALVDKKKELRIRELAAERAIDKLKDAHYFKERASLSQKDAEKSAKLCPDYDEAYQLYCLIYAERERIEGMMKAIEMKAKALDVIIRSDISERYIQQ